MTITDLKLKFCNEHGVQYDNFLKDLCRARNGYGEWLEKQLLILIKNKEDVEEIKRQIEKLEGYVEELERECGK